MRRTPYFVTGTDTEIGKTFMPPPSLELDRERETCRVALSRPRRYGKRMIPG